MDVKTTPPTTTIPDGYMVNPKGHLVPVESIREADKMRDDLVRKLIALAEEMHLKLSDFKRLSGDEMAAFEELSANEYGVEVGGDKGNLCLSSYDGSLKVERRVSEVMGFDERLNTAKHLLDEQMREWATDARPEIRTLIMNAFQVDKKGRINTSAILGLRKYKIQGEKWDLAMKAIGEAITTNETRTYYAFSKREAKTGKFVSITLDIASV